MAGYLLLRIEVLLIEFGGIRFELSLGKVPARLPQHLVRFRQRS